MKRKWFNTPPSQSGRSVDLVRISIAVLSAVHGTHGLLNPSDTNGFGEYLGSIGFPFGVALAWSIMFIQVAGSIALLFRRFVLLACFVNIQILGFGIGLIHAVHGWFVVGPGRDGVEYNVLLIACFVAVGWGNWPRIAGDMD
jgi:putative oxidoreductase